MNFDPLLPRSASLFQARTADRHLRITRGNSSQSLGINTNITKQQRGCWEIRSKEMWDEKVDAVESQGEHLPETITIPIHSYFLMATSSIMCSVLKQSGQRIDPVQIRCQNPFEFVRIVALLYTNTLQVEWENALTLFEIAREFKFDSISSALEEHVLTMLDRLSYPLVTQFYRQSNLIFGCDDAPASWKSLILELLLENLQRLMERKVTSLDGNVMKTVLDALLGGEEIPNEMIVGLFNWIDSWRTARTPREWTECGLQEVVDGLPLKRLSPLQLSQLRETDMLDAATLVQLFRNAAQKEPEKDAADGDKDEKDNWMDNCGNQVNEKGQRMRKRRRDDEDDDVSNAKRRRIEVMDWNQDDERNKHQVISLLELRLSRMQLSALLEACPGDIQSRNGAIEFLMANDWAREKLQDEIPNFEPTHFVRCFDKIIWVRRSGGTETRWRKGCDGDFEELMELRHALLSLPTISKLVCWSRD